MVLRTGADIDINAIQENLKRITNQIYKLLPTREENLDWETPLNTIVQELSGMDRLLLDHHVILFSLLCKLDGLFLLINEEDFFSYRRTIFECLNLMSSLKEAIAACQE